MKPGNEHLAAAIETHMVLAQAVRKQVHATEGTPGLDYLQDRFTTEESWANATSGLFGVVCALLDDLALWLHAAGPIVHAEVGDDGTTRPFASIVGRSRNEIADSWIDDWVVRVLDRAVEEGG